MHTHCFSLTHAYTHTNTPYEISFAVLFALLDRQHTNTTDTHTYVAPALLLVHSLNEMLKFLHTMKTPKSPSLNAPRVVPMFL